MAETRSVVITGASRGLGLASAALLYKRGWQVVAAMRSVDAGMERLREATGAADDDPRLIGVTLDLTDSASVAAAAKSIEEAVGAPYALVHNAGISAAGMAEETPMSLWERMFETTVLGPVALTNALLPAMRDAGRGRIVVVSSAGGVRGCPRPRPIPRRRAPRSGGRNPWPVRSRRSVWVSRSWSPVRTTPRSSPTPERPTVAISTALRAPPRHHGPRGRLAMKYGAKSPDRFAAGLAKALESTKPFARRPVGPDARMLLTMSRVLPSAGVHQMIRVMMGLPRYGAIKSHESENMAETPRSVSNRR